MDTEIPAGNAIIESVIGDTIRFRPDLRDTTEPWFYWNLRVRGCAGRTLRFELSVRLMREDWTPFVVPMVDFAGVEAGDQGKARAPRAGDLTQRSCSPNATGCRGSGSSSRLP